LEFEIFFSVKKKHDRHLVFLKTPLVKGFRVAFSRKNRRFLFAGEHANLMLIADPNQKKSVNAMGDDKPEIAKSKRTLFRERQ